MDNCGFFFPSDAGFSIKIEKEKNLFSKFCLPKSQFGVLKDGLAIQSYIALISNGISNR